MPRRIVVPGLLAIALGAILSAQGPSASKMTVVTGEAGMPLQAWQAGANGVDKVWEAKPREADATWSKRRAEALGNPRSTAPVIADLDGDGVNELVVMDRFGITVYGRNPAYYRFERVVNFSGPAPLVVGDVDGDGKPEIVVYRDVGEGWGIEIFKITSEGLHSLWSKKLSDRANPSWVLALGDADNDGQNEILVGSTVAVLKRGAGPTWEQVSVLPNLGNLMDDLRIADVDGDGKNEVVIGGNGAKVTVHKYRKYLGGLDGYPVVWQSHDLLPEGMKPLSEDGRPFTFVAGVEIADVNGDKKPEIIVATSDSGVMGDRKITDGGRVHVFRLDGATDFTTEWVSDFVKTVSVHMLQTADIDGDGGREIVVNGRDVFKHDPSGAGYRLASSLCATCTVVAVGTLGDLREPTAATRIVPLYWTAGRELPEGESVEATFTLFNPWAEAKDVTITVTSANDRVTVANGVLHVPSLSAGATAVTPRFTLTANAGKDPGKLQVEITAAGGYRQVMPVTIGIGDPAATYEPGVEAHLAAALERARDDNRRVLVVWGAKADLASQNLLRTIRKDSTVSQTMLYEYEVVRAETKGAEKAAARYKAADPKQHHPALTVLDGQGKVLANQPAAPFATGGENAAAYDATKLNDFLTKFKPVYVNAEPRLAEALSAAKKEQKTLFVWFSAPW